MKDTQSTDRELWNERYRTGTYHQGDDPASLLAENVEWLPDGRALDVATGTGRHALFLAQHGYEVDGVDISEEGLAIARQRAGEAGVADRTNWIQADLDTYPVPEETYAVVCVIGYYDLNLIGDLIDALVPGGVLLYEHHLGPASIADRGPRTDRFRARSNELLQACLDLTILEYREHAGQYGDENGDAEQSPRVRLIARNGLAGEPWYPPD